MVLAYSCDDGGMPVTVECDGGTVSEVGWISMMLMALLFYGGAPHLNEYAYLRDATLLL